MCRMYDPVNNRTVDDVKDPALVDYYLGEGWEIIAPPRSASKAEFVEHARLLDPGLDAEALTRDELADRFNPKTD